MKKTMITALLSVFLVFSSAVGGAETITLATLNWEPFYGKNLPENGFFSALSREAFKRAGYEMKIVFVPWNRALEMARKGKYDGLLGAYYNENRAANFYFTDPVSKNEEVFFQNRGRGISYKDISELKKFRIGGLRGGAPTIELREKGFGVDGTTDDIIGIKMLAAGRFDLMISGKQQFLYILHNVAELKKFQGAFEIVKPPYKSYDLFCPITKKRKDAGEIVGKFNKALQEMRNDGTYDSIMKRFGQQ